MHRYHQEESIEPKDLLLAFRKVLEQIFSRVITIENVNEIRFFCT